MSKQVMRKIKFEIVLFVKFPQEADTGGQNVLAQTTF
jgi:hypothetical protein